MKKLVATGLAALLVLGGCAATEESVESGDEAIVGLAREPLAMPKPILTFLDGNQWGRHHLEWHTVRQWDRLGPVEQRDAKKQHWSRADVMEGAKGNGLEFLAMHRVMIRTLIEKFPKNADLFAGWAAPPTDLNDKEDPCSGCAPFDPVKNTAIDKLQNHLTDFKTDDELGLFIETSVRPTSKDANARATDKTVGIHNYLHNRFMDPNSKVDLGDPSVNLQNKRFWRLHGWIECRWTEFRRLKGLSESDPTYRAALKKGEDMFLNTAKGPVGAGPTDEPSDALKKFFENNP